MRLLMSILSWPTWLYPMIQKHSQCFIQTKKSICVLGESGIVFQAAFSYLKSKHNFDYISLKTTASLSFWYDISYINTNITFTLILLHLDVLSELSWGLWFFSMKRFILPISFSWKLNFIKSQFAGQLPQQYQEGSDATKVIPPNMNDMNREEFSRYVS